MQAATVVFSADSIAVAKSASQEKRASGVHHGPASENSGARVETDRRKAYAKRESALVVTVGILDATAWLTATGTPIPPCPF
jgi:hypothetical protein